MKFRCCPQNTHVRESKVIKDKVELTHCSDEGDAEGMGKALEPTARSEPSLESTGGEVQPKYFKNKSGPRNRKISSFEAKFY